LALALTLCLPVVLTLPDMTAASHYSKIQHRVHWPTDHRKIFSPAVCDHWVRKKIPQLSGGGGSRWGCGIRCPRKRIVKDVKGSKSAGDNFTSLLSSYGGRKRFLCSFRLYWLLSQCRLALPSTGRPRNTLVQQIGDSTPYGIQAEWFKAADRGHYILNAAQRSIRAMMEMMMMMMTGYESQRWAPV